MIAQAEESGASAWSTLSVPPERAAEYWCDAVCAAYLPFAVEVRQPARFRGDITLHHLDGYSVSVVRAEGQDVRRTARLAAAGDDEYLLASIQTAGRATVEQGDRFAVLRPGDMTLNLTSRPFELHFDGPFEQVVVQIPIGRILELTGLGRGDIQTAMSLRTTGSLAPVTSFFRALMSTSHASPHERTTVGEAGVQLIASAVLVASGIVGPHANGLQPLRSQAQRLIIEHLADPCFDVNALARMCAVSRRTLYRAFAADGEGVSSTMRRMRVEQARRLLRLSNPRSLTAVAEACGFSTERQFYRAFKDLSGMTPGEYRNTWHTSSANRHR